jgi:hypothetical protein
MNAKKFLKLVSRIIAIPLAWYVATGSSGAVISQQNNTRPTNPSSEIPQDRLSVLRSLLGRDVVPSEQTSAQSTTLHSEPLWTVAGDDSAPTGSPPPPPPP